MSRAKEQMKLARERLETVLEAMPSAVVIVESDGRFSYLNRRALDLYGIDYSGFDLEAHLAKAHALRPDGSPFPLEEMPVSYALKSGLETRNVEMSIQRADGTQIPVLVSAAPLFDSQGNVSAAVATFEDITERKKAEQELGWTRQRDELIAGVTGELLSTVETQSIVNDLALRTMRFLNCDVFFNYLVDEKMGGISLNAYYGVPEEEAEKMRHLEFGAAVCGRVAQGGRRIIVRDIMTSEDERTPFLKSQEVQAYACHPLLAEGKVIGTLSFGTKSKTHFSDEELSVMREVSDYIAMAMHRLMERRALEEKEEKYRHLVKYAPTGIYEVDFVNKRFKSINDAMSQILGYSEEELLAMSPFDILDEDSRREFAERIRKSLAGEERDETVEYKVIAKDGRDIWASLNVSFTYDKGKATGALVVAHDITERKKSEEALSQNEAVFRSFFESPGIIRGIVDVIDWKDVRYIRTNADTTKYAGRQSGTMDGKLVSELGSPPELVKAWLERYRESFQTGKPITFNSYDARKGGHWFSATVSYLGMTENGDPRFSYVMIDITSQKKAEEALKESEEKFRGLFNSMTEYLQVLEPVYDESGKPLDYILIDVNPAWERLTGMKKEDVVGHRAKELFGVVEDSWLEAFDTVMKTGKPMQFENYGAALDKFYSLSVWKTPENQIAFTAMDITDVKRAQRAVEEERQRLLSLINSMTDEVWVANSEGKVIMVNPAAAEEFHLHLSPTGEDVGKVASSFEVFRPDGSPRPPEEAPPLRALRSGEVVEQEEIVRTPATGELRHRQVVASPIWDPEGRIIGSVSVVRDITDIKRNEEELKRSNEELRQFAYVASHDLQEPLRMVSTYLGLLERRHGEKLDGSAREYMDFAVQGADRMRELINDLLAFSRLDTRAKPFSTTNMNEVVKRAIENLITSIESHHAQVTVDKLPTIKADDGQMVQLMQNLIGNAVKFHSDKPPEVRISSRENWREFVFAVKDNGIGIAPEYQEKIFEMFQRLHSRDGYEGTGIGLAIAKRIVERHGGKIWVESDGENGSVFYFTIPKAGGRFG